MIDNRTLTAILVPCFTILALIPYANAERHPRLLPVLIEPTPLPRCPAGYHYSTEAYMIQRDGSIEREPSCFKDTAEMHTAVMR